DGCTLSTDPGEGTPQVVLDADGFRESYVMVSQKGTVPSWFVEKKSARYGGPTSVEAYIPTGCVSCTWLTRNSSWVVQAAGGASNAAKAFDGNPTSKWNPSGYIRNYSKWDIVLDLTAPQTLTTIAFINYGDTYHDIAGFTLQASRSASPYNWEEAVSFNDGRTGTTERQKYGGFQATARYWRFVVTRTPEGFQPWLREINFYGILVLPPEDLKCRSETTNSFSLHWEYPNAYLSGYHIWYLHESNDVEATELLTSLEEDSRSVNVTISSLKSGSKYNVTVRNVVSTSESGEVTIQCITETDNPQSLTCSKSTYNSIVISWMKPRAPLIGYRVNYTLSNDSPSNVISTDFGPENEEQMLQHVLADREYSITLVAVGIYKESSPVEITCATLTPPPEDFKVTGVTETSITVSWKQRTDSLSIGHRMWIGRSDTAESLFTQLHVVPTGQTDLTFTDLTPATEYVISATSINSYNEGPAVNITVGTKTDSPTSLYVDQKSMNSVTISWSPPEAVLTGYNITYTGNKYGRLSTSKMEPGDVDSCKLSGLVPSTRYDIDVVAVSRFGSSIAVSISVITDTDPPTNLQVTKFSTTWLFLEWTSPVANVLAYDLDISDEYGSTRTLLR
ncbi:hypothetical protein Bbelb_028170, partial [Branchiostoma belcheri]